MKHWICTYTSSNDQGLGVGVIADSEEEPYIEWENTEWLEITKEDKILCENDEIYRDIILKRPLYVVLDVVGKLLYTGSYMACEWYKDKGEGKQKLAFKILPREEFIKNTVEKIKKSVWFNTLNRMLEIEGGKLNNDSIKLVKDLAKHYLTPKHEFSQDWIELEKSFKVKFITFNDSTIPFTERIIYYDLGSFIRIRLTFGDRPINHDAVIDINLNLI